MARAKRHYIPEQIWHITHRCHRREFLLKFGKDCRRWVHWLFEAKKRYGLPILNYAVTSNHIHLLVVGGEDRDVISSSIRLVAGRTGQEYNQRKGRRGAFWEDRYHATAVESGEHLLQCIVYIDLNMMRADVVGHPSEWPFCGYSEIQEPKRRKALIDHDKLKELLGFDSHNEVKTYHERWVSEYIESSKNRRDDKWTKSIAVGSKGFVEEVKRLMGVSAIGRKRTEAGGAYQLREPSILYGEDFEAKKGDLRAENTYLWDINL